MAIRSKEFVGKAEGIKSQEVSSTILVKNLESTLVGLDQQENWLESTLSDLQAELAAAQSDTDADGYPDFGLIAAIENQIDQTYRRLEHTRQEISKTSVELKSAEREYEKVQEEKRQTLFEIQQRARTTSQNLSKAQGIYGAYADIGSSLAQSFQEGLDALSNAASILGGTVDSGSGGAGGRGNSASVGRGRTPGMAGATMAIRGAHTIKSSSAQESIFRSTQISGRCSMSGRYTSATHGKIGIGKPSLISEQKSAVGSHTGIHQRLACTKSNFETKQERHIEQKAYVKRTGSNAFKDSLIEQDWELGKYSDQSMQSAMAYRRKNSAKDDYEKYIQNPERYQHKECNQFAFIDPACIQEIRNIDDPNFWKYKSTPMKSYVEMAKQIPKVYELLKAGYNIHTIAKREDVLGACASQYFIKKDITVTRVGNGFIFGGDGRHRIMAALIAGVQIPAQITDEMILQEQWKQPAQTKREKFSEEFRKKLAERSTEIVEQIKYSDENGLMNTIRTEQIANTVDFGEMDLKVAKKFTETLVEVKQKYPFIKLGFVGSFQAYTAKIKKCMEETMNQLYSQYDTELSEEEIKGVIKITVDRHIQSSFAKAEGALATSISIKAPRKKRKPQSESELNSKVLEYIERRHISQNRAIVINEDKALRIEELEVELNKLVADGKAPKRCNTIRYLVLHEIAHQIDFLLGISSDPEVQQLYKEFKGLSEEEQKDALCIYGRESREEFVAEAWAESQCSDSPRAIAQLIGKKVEIEIKKYNGEMDEDDGSRQRQKNGGFER